MLAATLSNATATTNAYQNSATTEINGNLKHVIKVAWTPGVIGNVLSINPQTRFLVDSVGTAWTPDMTWGAAAGTKTKTDNVYTHTATGTTEVGFTIILEGGGDDLRVQFKESDDGAAGKGTIKIKVYSVNA